MLSDAGNFPPSEAAALVAPVNAPLGGSPPSWRSRVPEPPITLLKDLRRARAGRRAGLGRGGGPWDGHDIRFVWQRHVLFRRDGIALSRALGVPMVLSVHAMQVEEAASWGVGRPGWSRYAERWGELPQLQAADLLACVSDAVAASVAQRGVAEERILVTPNGVDLDHFRPRPDRDALRERLGLTDRFVVGWSGSFRRFHGLELALSAMSQLQRSDPEVVLLLMGDGQQRAALEQHVADLGLDNVRFTGAVSYEEMPRHLSACDAGLVLSPAEGSFHYSPVKLREYMACGLPVVAHRVGELEHTLQHEVDALLIPPGSTDALARGVARLRAEDALRERLARRGQALARERWSWDLQVQRVLTALGR